MKYLKEKYKTYDGARKRAVFENSLAKSEFERGFKAKYYRYAVAAMPIDGQWRVARVERVIQEDINS